MQDSHTAATVDETAADPNPLRLASASAVGCRNGWPAGWTSAWPYSLRT